MRLSSTSESPPESPPGSLPASPRAGDSGAWSGFSRDGEDPRDLAVAAHYRLEREREAAAARSLGSSPARAPGDAEPVYARDGRVVPDPFQGSSRMASPGMASRYPQRARARTPSPTAGRPLMSLPPMGERPAYPPPRTPPPPLLTRCAVSA